MSVLAQATDLTVGRASDGSFTWWQLEDNTWVREDVVSVQGDCAGVPIVQ